MNQLILTTGRPNRFIEEELARHFMVRHLDLVDHPEAVLAELAPHVRGLANCGAAPASLITRLPALEIIAHFGVGYDTIDVAAASARGIIVTHTPDVLSEEVADTALGLLIMTVRRLGAAERFLRAGCWTEKNAFPLTPGSLRGRHLGIVGLGRIGRAIARRAESFGLAIAYHSRKPVTDVSYPYFATPLALAHAVDTLMVVLPGGAETYHVIDRSILSALGANGVLINIGRGSVVDEAALVSALEAGELLGAGLDVFEHEPHVPPALSARDDVVLLPHVGSASETTRQAMARLQVENLRAWFAGETPPTPVPETPLPSSRFRAP